jgi:hypothetical protein
MDLYLGFPFVLLPKGLQTPRTIHPVYGWLWRSLRSACQNKRKFFFWLLLKDRLSTRKLLRQKNMFLQDYNCVLCRLRIEESPIHLFLSLPVAIQCWNLLHLVIGNLIDPFAILMSFKSQLVVPFFMKILVFVTWAIWTIRNDNIPQPTNINSALQSYFSSYP